MRYLKFNDSQFIRASAAWCPVTGKAHKPYEPRVVENFIIQPNVEPRIYYRFPVTQGFTAYNSDPACYHRDGETTDYLDDWMTVLEVCNPSVERILLGLSYEGRDIEAFRLGPTDRQHFVINCVIHGNESDGLSGNLKAFEILLTHPDFERLRNEYTLFFIPCCNPDGFYFGTRNLRKLGPHPSGIPTGINLNRVWPWFWDDFTPTGDESKGAVPMDCPEAQALYLWRTEGNSGQPTPIRFLMDQHATAGDGARYQSRDRNFKEISEYDWFSCWADYIIYRHMKATQTKRVWEDDMPDLFINYFRSRFVPHWHTWNANATRLENGGIQPVVMVNEYNKVAYVTVETDPETYQSACNYTLDYILSCALVMQSGFYEARDAVLIEPTIDGPSVNSFLNPSFTQWQEKSTPLGEESYRPGYWSSNRVLTLESSREDRHVEYQGRPYTLEANLKFEVPSDTTVGPTDVHHIHIETNTTTSDYMYIASVIDTGGFCFSKWSLGTNLAEKGRDIIADNTQQLRFASTDFSETKYVLLGNETTGLTYVDFVYYLSVRTVLVTYPTARMNAATAWEPAPNSVLYILGGETTAGVYTKTVLSAITAGTISEIGTNLLPTANSGSAATYCKNGSLDGKIVMVGGKSYHVSKLRVVIIDPVSPSATEYLVTISDTTLSNKIVGSAIWYDEDDTIWIYGGEDPDTGFIHAGVWTIRWTGSTWVASDEILTAEAGDDSDPEDYGGTSIWSRSWSNWHCAKSVDTDTGGAYVMLLGGLEQDPSTGLDLPGPYQGAFMHDPQDGTLTRPEYINYGYARQNIHFDVLGYDKISTGWSLKAEPGTSTGYVRINNSTGDSNKILTVRRTRTYYMHPPRWWWREHASLDLLANTDPFYTEDEWRAYIRVYQDSQPIAFDAPMLQLGGLWPYSWVPSGVMRSAEEIQWNNCIDARWMRVSLTFQPQASYLCLDADLTLVTILCESPSTAYLSVSFVAGDTTARTYVRDQVHNVVDPVIRLTYYDSVKGVLTCDVIVYWGGYLKDTARARFDTPITMEIWQHATYGCGLIINNAGSIGKAWIPGVMDKSLWSATPAYLTISGGGWWAEPIIYEITDSWVHYFAAKQEPTGALQLGDRDGTFGQVSERSTYRYIERFTRADDINLGDFWDVITQTGNGWDIHSNQARCNGIGWERWDAFAYYRDTSIIGDVKVSHTTSRVGFFSRIHWGQAGITVTSSISYAHGYLGSLSVAGDGSSTLEIEDVFRNADVQDRAVLVSVSCPYTLSDTIELEFEAVGSTLTLTARVGVTELASCTVDDTSHPMAGAFGICGETTSSTRYVYIDNVRAEPRGLNKVRITD